MQTDSMELEGAGGDDCFGSDRARVSVNAANITQVSAFGGDGNHAHLTGLVPRRRQVPERLRTLEVRHGDA